jgi:hypothetical protein
LMGTKATVATKFLWSVSICTDAEVTTVLLGGIQLGRQ